MADTGGKNPKDDNSGATRSHAEDGGNVSEPTDRSTKKETEEKQNKNGKLSPRAITSATKQSGSSKFVDAKKAQFEQQQELPRSPRAESHLENQTSNKAGITTKTDNLSGQSVCRTEENSQKFCVDKRYTGVGEKYKKETKSSETGQREDYKTEGTTGDSSLESGLKEEQMPATTAGCSNYDTTSSGHGRIYMKDLDNSMVLVGYSKEISIYVKWPCGKTVKLQIDPSDGIYSVKSKLGNPDRTSLMFQDKELLEDKPWFHYEIKDGDTLYALNRQESDKSSTAVDLKNTQNQPITTGDSSQGNGSKGMQNPAITTGDTTGGNGSKVTEYPAMTAGESSGENDTKGLQNQPMCTVDTTGGNDRTGMQNPAMTTGDSTGGNDSKGVENLAKTTVDTTGGNGSKGVENLAKTAVDNTGGKGAKGVENLAKTTVDTTGGNGLKGVENQPASTGDSAEGSDLTQRQEPGMSASNADEGHELTEIHKKTMTACDSPADLQVFVVAFDQEKIAVDVKPDETVAAVKKKLMDKKHPDCDIDGFSLNSCGEKLDDMQTVESCLIQPNGEIIMKRERSKAGKKEKMHPLSSTDEHGTGATDEHGTGATVEHGTGATVEHGTGADQALESDEDIQPCYNNNLEESTGNPVNFDEGLVSDKACNEGSILKLKCSVNKQDMKAMWYKDGKPLEQSERITQISKDLTHILKIQNVCLSDAGNYTVNIENLESTSKVTVRGNPLAFKDELFNEENLNEGLNLNLRCSVNKLHVKPTWYKDWKPLERNERITQTSEGFSHILEIQNVCLQDSGKYTVKIENIESTSKVTVLEKPLAVTLSLEKSTKAEIGKEVKMKCIVSKPNLKAEWTFNGKVIKNMETRIIVESSEMWHQLTIKNVTMDDAGEYCLEIEDLQEKTILEVCDDKENENIGGARGNSSPIFNSSSRHDETDEYVRLKDTSHVNEDATHDYVNIAGQDITVGLNEQMAKQNSFTTSKSKHSDTLKETHRSSKTVSSGNEGENFNDDSHSSSLNLSTGVCQLKKNRSAAVPASKNLLIPEKGHGLHTASVQTVEQSSSKMVKGKSMVNPCGKDQGDSSQSDDESNPHSSNEDPDVDELTASFKIRLKLNDSDDQQIAGQHGSSGQADSQQLHVRVKFSGDTQRPVPLTLKKYMKYHYLLNHEKYFTNVANDLKNKKQIDISVKGGVLHIDQGIKYEKSYCINTVMDFIFRHTENIVENGWPYSGVDIEKVEQELLSTELGKLKEIYIRRYKDEMHVAYESSLSMKLEQDVLKAFKKFLFANKGNISKTCDVPYILHRILKNTDWKKQFEDEYPNVQVEWEPDDDEDVVKVVFSGNKEKVLEAMKWFEDKIVGEYCCCSEEMKKIPELDLFSQPEDVVLEYVRVKYENQTDILFDINRKRAKVWLYSISQQAKADAAKKVLTIKGEIVKTDEIPVAKTLLHDTGINQLIPDWTKSKYAVVQVDEDKIVVKGLEKYVQELKGTIEAMLKSKHKQNMSETDCFLECDRRFLNLIEENGVLKDLSDKKQIQYRLVEKGIFYRGEVSNFSKFDDELKKMKKEYTTHYVDIHVSKEMDRTEVYEILHKTEVNYDGHIKIDENKDTTPGNYQTATVLGPTLKDDLQDCLYTRWCLKTCTVTLAEKLSDLSSADLVFVPVDENSKSDFSQSVKKIAVPIPKYKQTEGKTLIDQVEKDFDLHLSDEACISVCIKSSAISGWSRCKYVKPILYSLMKWAKESKGQRKDIVLCCLDKDAFDCCFEYCHDAFGTQCMIVKPMNKDLYMDEFVVEVRKGGIVDFAVDVIVNTTSDDLKLDSGAVSSTILNSAGPELQNDVKQKKPDGIAYGEILETKAFKLKKAKVILHGALEAYDKTGKSLQKLEEFVSSCFSHADSKQYTSIALPAIGTGNLGYSKSEVAASMFKASKKFFRDHHPSALRRVLFVIHEKDIKCLKAFKAEEILWNQYLVSQSSAVVYEGVRVQPNQGSILDTTTDAVIYFWDDGKVHGSITTRSNIVLAACGRDVFDTVSKKMRLKDANMMTLKAENIKVDMFLTRCQNSSDEISKATRECLLKADKCKDITSICIAFDKSHTFLLNKELTYNLCEAIKDVSHELHQINQVEIMVENEKSFQEVLEYFNMEKAGLLKMKEPLRIVVSGFKEHVAKAVAEIKEKFSQLQTGNDITEAEHENDKKDTEIKGTTLDKEYIEPSPIFAKYVEVHHIPKGLDIVGLRKDLFREGEFPVLLPKLVYYVGSSKALLICQSEQDAKKLSECTKQEPYKFSSVKGKAVSLLTTTIDQNTVEKMKEVDKYDEFKQELVRAEIQIAGESPFKFVAPSTFQCSYAMSILKKLTGTPSAPHVPGSIQDNETVTSEHDGFHNIETIKDVQENVWDILCSYEFIKIKGKDISYGEKSITVVIGQVVSKDDFLKITAIVDDLRGKEWDEIPLEAQHCNKSTVDRWCDEVKEVTGYKCCKYIAGKGKILVYAVNYDDILKIKHLIGVKTGKIKTTGKARRGGKATSDNDRRQVDTAGSFGAESKSPYRRINGKNFQKYITKENIHVFVYEANILELDVDCIVNAANESLQHGGGVAAVIEKGAGYRLTKESNDFVSREGNLPVGKACTTTAGNLSYNCVIHTVGPRWSAYSPHSMQDVQDCQRHLYQAVYNSFLEAEKRGLKSIALPAISSAIFGVPEEICVQQYALATFDYSKRTSDVPTALKEIHFIDKNSNIVKKIQDAFNLVFVKGEMPDCDPSKFVKSRRHRRGHSPGSYTGAQAGFSSSVHRDSFNASTQSATSDVYEVTQIEPLSFFENKSYAYAYLLHGKEEYKLLLSRGDLLKVKASAVVIPVDNRGYRGNIAGSLFSKIPELYREDYTFKLSSECHRKTLCDVFITQGYECGYPFILHAIYPANAKDKDISQRKHDVQKLYKNVFSLCDTKTGIQEVVAPLLGPDIRSETDIRACAEMFLQSYLDYYSRPVTKKSLLVHLVCREDLVYDCVKRVFDDYVMSKKAELNKTQEYMDTSASIQTVEKPDNVHEEENCVICMDTITDPETLKCGHTFCKDCIQQQFQFKEACPTCGQVCGVITGDQPAGEMRYAVDRYTDCSGYNGHGRIAITYNFPSGRQGPEHPSPGTFYKGITRVAYLPNNDEGRKILAMLEVAFKRKLVFTIGNSRTTGQEGVITWNDIHHKTNPRSHQQFGYPDPGYLERVKDELAVKGVTEKDIPKTISR